MDELENREYPLGIKAAQVFVTGGTLLIFSAVLYWSFHAWGIFLSLFGSYKVSQQSSRPPYGRDTVDIHLLTGCIVCYKYICD